MNILKTFVLIFGLFCWNSGWTQTIVWNEDFDGLADETTVDNGTTAWSTSTSNLRHTNFTNGTHFGVNDGAFLARNLHLRSDDPSTQEATLITEEIDISGQSNIYVYIEGYSSFSDTGSGGFEPDDYIEFSYSLDGGPVTQFANNGYVNNNFVIVMSSSNCSSSGLSGSTLQIFIEFTNSSVNEYYNIDNIKIVSDPDRPDPADFDYVASGEGDWNSSSTWAPSGVPGAGDDVLIECNATVRLTGNHNVQNVTVNSGGALLYDDDNAQLTVASNGKMTIRDGALFRVGGTTQPEQFSNVRLTMSGDAEIENNSGYNQAGQININGAGSTITLTGSGELEAEGIAFNANNQSFDNQSRLILTSSISGSGTNKSFVNAAGSNLDIRSTNLHANTALSFEASASGNAVWYNASGNQDVYQPDNGYHDLVIANSGNKTTSGTFYSSGDVLDINGDLLIRDDARLDVSGNNIDITLAGDLTNNSNDSNPYQERSSTMTLDGSGDQTIDRTTGDEYFYDLVIDKSAGAVTLSTVVQIRNSATFTNGVINTDDTNIMNFQNNATTNGGNSNSYVNGPVQKTGDDAFVFPIGKDGKWARLGISAPSQTSTVYQAEYFYEEHSNNSTSGELEVVSEVEYWDLSQEVNDDDVQVTLYWSNSAESGIDQSSDLVVAHFNSGANNWESVGASAVDDGASGSVTSNIVTDYSPFTFGSTSFNNTLPIQLIDFKATVAGQKVRLDWKTASEKNNDYFTIERSTDYVNFEPIQNIQGAGNSMNVLSYHAYDERPTAGRIYYRLKQTDFDGTFAYSNIVTVEVESLMIHNELRANVQHNTIQISGVAAKESSEVALIGMDGRIHKRVRKAAELDGSMHIEISDVHLATGYYLLQLYNHSGSQATRVYIQ